jgi:hypothetical protein
MPVVQYGDVNTTALTVPNLTVQIMPPSGNFINGIPTNICGFVGTASWGPVNSPVTVSDLSSYTQALGPIKTGQYDLGTAVWAACQNGANDIRCVRVTDGTDVAASVAISTNITFTAKYTGTVGNDLKVYLSSGSAGGSWKVVIQLPGMVAEVFDSLGAGATGNGIWVAIAAAINTGISGLRGPSAYVVATVGAGTGSPSANTYSLSGGTDGAGNVTSTHLLGQDTAPRSGMFALRKTGVSVAALVGCSDRWTEQLAFSKSEGVYMFSTTPQGDTISNVVSSISSAGVRGSYFGQKILFGDWVYINDPITGQTRLISPQAFAVGRASALSPEQGLLNKQIVGILGTQSSVSNKVYADAELGQLVGSGLDLIANPCPGGDYFGIRLGVNTCLNPVTNGDNHTRLTNYIAYTLNRGMGMYIGKLQSPTTRQQALGTLNAFLGGMWQQGMIGDVNNPTKAPFSCQCDARNNPPSRVALGYMQGDVKVKYLSVITQLLVNVDAGVSVEIVSTQSA